MVRLVNEATQQATRDAAQAEARAAGAVGRGDFDAETGLFEWYDGLSTGAVIGENVKRLREAKVLTQHELVHALKRNGLNWARSKLSALEAGSRPQVSASDLMIFAITLQVPLAELFAGPGRVELSPHEASIDRDTVRQLVAGKRITPSRLSTGPAAYRAQVAHHESLPESRPAQADVELAQRLGRHPSKVLRAAMELFDGQTLTMERDRRVERLGAMSVQERTAHRGHITRELGSQVADLLEQWDAGGVQP